METGGGLGICKAARPSPLAPPQPTGLQVHNTSIASFNTRVQPLGYPEFGRGLAQGLDPPAVADHVQFEIADGRTQRGQHVQGVLELLVWHHAAEHAQPRRRGRRC